MRDRATICLFILSLLAQTAWSQTGYGQQGDIPVLEEARITDIGVAVRDIGLLVVTDSLTQKADTAVLIADPDMVWLSEQVDVFDRTSV